MSTAKNRKQTQQVVASRMLAEINQGHETRRQFIQDLQTKLGRSILTFFTSMSHPVIIADIDNDMIEGMLQALDRKSGITMILNSPGGSALAAQRIINTCRTYTNGDFEVIVPRMAKSAATMICFGANRILMPKTAELGPVDPQVVITPKGGQPGLCGVYYLKQSYDNLFDEAVNTKGNIQPYLQQLDRYDSREIKQYEVWMQLGEDIAIKSLQIAMMKGKSTAQIRKKIARFIDPEKTKSHGRPIYLQDAKKSGLKVEEIDIGGDIWPSLWELYLRSNSFVNSERGAKLIESVDDSFIMPVPD